MLTAKLLPTVPCALVLAWRQFSRGCPTPRQAKASNPLLGCFRIVLLFVRSIDIIQQPLTSNCFGTYWSPTATALNFPTRVPAERAIPAIRLVVPGSNEHSPSDDDNPNTRKAMCPTGPDANHLGRSESFQYSL
jgi:hypothetical protein